MSQDTYGGEVHDPASLHRYRYANGNPANFVDPSGNDAASELAFNIGYRFGQEIGEAAELGAGILCVYDAEAAGIDLVNHWTSDTRVQKAMRITTLGLTAAGCAAIIKGIGGPPELEPIEPESGEFSPTICPMCFAAGTPVHTEHGEEPIEKLKVGERVYALDRATGKTELEPITALVPMHKGNLVELKVQGDSESLRPSVRHPFWVKLSATDKGHWIEAANLHKGELLETIDGKWSKIESVLPVRNEETVYNFTVDKDHDYFIGQIGYLVHNAPACGCQWGQEGHHIVPENKLGFGPARGVLGRAGIGINDLANLLPLDYYYHRRIHTNAYRDWINRTLTEAESNGDSITCTLKDLGTAILNGKAVF